MFKRVVAAVCSTPAPACKTHPRHPSAIATPPTSGPSGCGSPRRSIAATVLGRHHSPFARNAISNRSDATAPARPQARYSPRKRPTSTGPSACLRAAAGPRLAAPPFAHHRSATAHMCRSLGSSRASTPSPPPWSSAAAIISGRCHLEQPVTSNMSHQDFAIDEFLRGCGCCRLADSRIACAKPSTEIVVRGT